MYSIAVREPAGLLSDSTGRRIRLYINHPHIAHSLVMALCLRQTSVMSRNISCEMDDRHAIDLYIHREYLLFRCFFHAHGVQPGGLFRTKCNSCHSVTLAVRPTSVKTSLCG